MTLHFAFNMTHLEIHIHKMDIIRKLIASRRLLNWSFFYLPDSFTMRVKVNFRTNRNSQWSKKIMILFFVYIVNDRWKSEYGKVGI